MLVFLFKHPHYNDNKILNDIAIFQLEKPIKFNEYVQPACMPNPSYGSYPDNVTNPAFTSGWVNIFFIF